MSRDAIAKVLGHLDYGDQPDEVSWRDRLREVDGLLASGVVVDADAAPQPRPVDAPGTCHLVGCPGKGQHAPHGIGVGSWRDYSDKHCLGTVEIEHLGGAFLTASCSLSDAWVKQVIAPIRPDVMALLVDRHRLDCPNRSPR